MAEILEKDALFDKSYTCPICDAAIKSKTVKTGKCKLVSTDDDLRPVYGNLDSLKYDVVFCPSCGYAALKKFFDQPLLPVQKHNIMEKVTKNYKGGGSIKEHETLSYEESIRQHKFALLSEIVKNHRISDAAYTCLKIAWLYRGQSEELERNDPSNVKKINEAKVNEGIYINKAYNGMSEAFMKEDFPMAGMDEMTFSYLLANLAYKTNHIEEANRWVSQVITSHSASQRVKEKARDLRESIVAAMEKQKAAE